MIIPTDPDSIGLVRAIRPFLGDKGKIAADDLLGAVNVMSIINTITDVYKSRSKMRNGEENTRPLAFLSMMADVNLDPTLISRAVESIVDYSSSKYDNQNQQSLPTSANNEQESVKLMTQEMPNGNANFNANGNGNEQLMMLIQSLMSKASNDPSLSNLLSEVSKNGINQETLSMIMNVLSKNAPNNNGNNTQR